MRNKFFAGLIMIAALATTACSAGMIKGVGQEIVFQASPFPIEQVRVMNNCYKSTILVATADGKEVAVKWGNAVDVFMITTPGPDGRPSISARGVGDEKTFLGTTFAYVTPRSQGGARVHMWRINSLDDGERSCAVPGQQRGMFSSNY